jgi:hypothetical protein
MCVSEYLYTGVFMLWWLSSVSRVKECLNTRKRELVSVLYADRSGQYSALYKMVCVMRRRQRGKFSLNCEQSATDFGFHVLKTGIKVRGF